MRDQTSCGVVFSFWCLCIVIDSMFLFYVLCSDCSLLFISACYNTNCPFEEYKISLLYSTLHCGGLTAILVMYLCIQINYKTPPTYLQLHRATPAPHVCPSRSMVLLMTHTGLGPRPVIHFQGTPDWVCHAFSGAVQPLAGALIPAPRHGNR